MNKNKVLSLVLQTLVLTSMSCLPVAAQHSSDGPYRVIFNCDGAGVFSNADGNVENWIRNIFAPLENSHVDALFWCDGAGGNTASYDSEVLELTGKRIGQVNPHLLRWIKEGNDPPKLVVREAHKRKLDVFYSFRVNDIHDGHIPAEFPTFKEENPEWMLGDQFGEFATSLNFGLPEVRELKLRTIEEIFDKYDFDGIELDLMRFPRFFREFLEYRNAFLLTDFMRTVRQRLDEDAKRRGRPVKIAVRVDENLTACQLNGFDLRTWINEGLLDVLIIGDYAFPGGRDIRVFKDLAHGKPVQVYVCVAHPHKIIGGANHARGGGSEVLRGLAANYWAQGADGMYTFNLFPHNQLNQVPLFREIGDPQAIATLDKVFLADCSEFGPGLHRHHPSSPRFHNWMFVTLPVTLHKVWNVESFTDIPIDVADDLSGANAEKVKSLRLWVELKNLVAGDVVDFRLNGQSLPPMSEPKDGGLIQFTLSPEQLKMGRNQVGVRLNQRGAQPENDIVLAGVEIHVDYE